MAGQTGVYPCYKNQFQIDTSTTGTATYTDIADIESYSVSIDNGVEEWNDYSSDGWGKRLMTAKSITISASGKRNVGDPGSDAVAELAFKNGKDVEKGFQWTFPSGMKVVFENAVINVTNIGAGDSTGVAPLEFEVMSNGKPTVTPAP